MDYDLTKKTGKGIAWNLISQAAQQIIHVIVIVILARLLTPEDFGIFAMIMIFFSLVEPFRQWGFQAFLIHKKDADREYEDTAFWLICATAVLLFLISVICAPLIAKFFNKPILTKFLIVGSIGFLFSPMSAVQWAKTNRNMDFKVIMIRDIIAAFIYGICACLLVLKGLGVWSLVISFLAKELSLSVIFLIISDWRPRLRFSYCKVKEMLRFCVNCIGSGVFHFFTSNIDNIFVGKYLGPANLGLYNLAFNTVSQPETKLVNQVTTVIFPAFSIIQHDAQRLRESYMKTFRMLSALLMPILSILFMCAKDIVLVVYGEKWLLAVIPIQIMCLYGLLKSLTEIAGPLFSSKGRPDIYMKICLFRLIIFIFFLFFGVHYGIVGVASAVFLYSILVFHPILRLCARMLKSGVLIFYLIILRYAGLSLLMVFVIFIVRIFTVNCHISSPFLRLLLESSSGLLIYFAVLKISLKSDFNDIVNIVKKVIS